MKNQPKPGRRPTRYTKSNPQVVSLDEVDGILRRIASAVIAHHGRYRCMISGVPTEIRASEKKDGGR